MFANLSPKLCSNLQLKEDVKYCLIVLPCTSIIPPIPATAYPATGLPNSKTKVFVSVANILCGNTIWPDEL